MKLAQRVLDRTEVNEKMEKIKKTITDDSDLVTNAVNFINEALKFNIGVRYDRDKGIGELVLDYGPVKFTTGNENVTLHISQKGTLTIKGNHKEALDLLVKLERLGE
jgi:hypothetical protein